MPGEAHSWNPENSGSVTIRPMREADVADCASIVLAIPLWGPYGVTDTEAARAPFGDVLAGTYLGLVAEDAGRVVGYIVYAIRGTFVHSGYVRSVAVAPDVQRRGVGGRLMDVVEAEILAHGPNVFLLVAAWNTDAQRFYERRGYRRIGELTDYVRRGITEVVYRKTLGPMQG
jgi:ribosomal protein S18 acetylase RimI-like enzyme